MIICLFLIFSSFGCNTAQPTIQEPILIEPTLLPLDPDNESSSINYDDLTTTFGSVPQPSKSYKLGVIVKFLGNQYWQLLAEGMQTKGDELGLTIDVRAGSTESDAEGQLQIMEDMIEQGYDAFLISPQTDENLIPALEKARTKGILVLNVNDAVLADVQYWVGPNQYENGVSAATYFKETIPKGGKVAVIEGLAGVYAANQRTKGFKDTLLNSNIDVIASVHGNWDLQQSLEAATEIINDHPDIKGFYCNNDIMALGVVEAVNAAGKLDEIMVIGTDGIEPAYDSIRADEMTATVDSFPAITGQVAVEVALRLLEGQTLPRAIYSPQSLITLNNIDNPLP